jgi:NADPH:quinone reductase
MTLPSTMQQIDIAQPGPPEVLVLRSVPTPVPAAGEVLIRVRAAGINRADVLQRMGHYPPPPGASPVPGLEIAGTIVEIRPGGKRWSQGDSVCALLAGGGYSEYAVAPAAQCLPIPPGFSAVEAAALPEACFTVWVNVFQLGRLARGESALIHGGTSGVGTTAIQLAHAFGAQVFTTAGSAAKCAACLRLGADAAINYRDADFAVEIPRLTGGRGVDVILDMVGGSYTAKNLSVLAIGGRLVQIAFMESSRVELDLRAVMTKQLTITGSTLRGRPVEQKGAIARELEDRVWPILAEGRFRSVIDKVYPLAEAAAAHRRMESGEHIGKIVLSMED